jgi:CheY-like chemotaxis protein
MTTEPLRIVVVDDDHDTTDILVWLLQTDGHEALGLYDGAHAVEHAAACHPDALLLDLAMPNLDGYEAARQIRQREGCQDILLIAITGYADETARQRASQAGFDHYLVKPIEYAALAQLLAGWKIPQKDL